MIIHDEFLASMRDRHVHGFVVTDSTTLKTTILAQTRRTTRSQVVEDAISLYWVISSILPPETLIMLGNAVKDDNAVKSVKETISELLGSTEAETL